MGKLSAIGRIFYGLSIAAMGFLTIYYKEFPYFLIPPDHAWISDHTLLVYLYGALLFLAGACIALKMRIMPVSLLLGTLLLLIFCLYFIPYQLMNLSNYKNFGAWENSAKELALAAGAFVVAGCYATENKNPLIGFLKKLIPIGTIVFAVTILSFGIEHFVYAKEAAGYVPSWIANPVLWLYITGTALIGSSVAILLRIRPNLFAALLGLMIFIWVLILHTPKAIAESMANGGGEISSGFLALAYCGIALVIASVVAGSTTRVYTGLRESTSVR